MSHLAIERRLLGYIARVCGEKIKGVHTYVGPEAACPYALLEMEDVRGEARSGIVSVSFLLHLVSRYQGSQEKTDLMDHIRVCMEKPGQEEGSFRLSKQEIKREQDNLTQKITLHWQSRLCIPQNHI
jgi:hypothetical protein